LSWKVTVATSSGDIMSESTNAGLFGWSGSYRPNLMSCLGTKSATTWAVIPGDVFSHSSVSVGALASIGGPETTRPSRICWSVGATPVWVNRLEWWCIGCADAALAKRQRTTATAARCIIAPLL
jgi:hypothetical protein